MTGVEFVDSLQLLLCGECKNFARVAADMNDEGVKFNGNVESNDCDNDDRMGCENGADELIDSDDSGVRV